MIFTSSTKWTFIEDLAMNQPRYPLSMFCNHQNLKTTKCHIMWNFTCEFEFHLVRKKVKHYIVKSGSWSWILSLW